MLLEFADTEMEDVRRPSVSPLATLRESYNDNKDGVIFDPFLAGDFVRTFENEDRRPAADIGRRYALIEGAATGGGTFDSFCSCYCHPSPLFLR
jgi:hypothetical protein